MSSDKDLLALNGLKWNPFMSNIPAEALWEPPVQSPSSSVSRPSCGRRVLTDLRRTRPGQVQGP